jgi:hypothetical protein
MTEENPTPEGGAGAEGEAAPASPKNPFAVQAENNPEPEPVADPLAELTPEQRAVLTEHGITPSDDGKITLTDHVKLLSALSSLRQQARKPAPAPTPDPDAEPPVDADAIRAETRREVEAELRLDVTKASVVAAAAAAGFADAKDAVNLVGDLAELTDEVAIDKAVKQLADAKPYLLARQVPQLEQGPQGKGDPALVGDWLREVVSPR